MNIEKVIQQLIIDEGLRLKSYYCPAGYLTIGIGRNLEGNGLTWIEMMQLIGNNPHRKVRFPKNYIDLEGKVLFALLLQDFRKFEITKEEAIFLCTNDVNICIEQLQKKLPWFDKAPDELKEVLVNMCFNMGIKTLMSFKNTLFYMSIKEYKKASENMLKSKWARQVKYRAVRLSDRVKALSNV